jgi:sodium/bile acid cotransporter 7
MVNPDNTPPSRHWSAVIARRWFLLVVTAGLTLSLAWPAGVRPAVGWLPTKVVVAAALFLTACGLESRHLLRAFTRPAPVLWAVAVSYGFLPVLAWLGGAMLPSGEMGVGLLVMAAVPCTLASAVLWTRLAGGNEATALLIVLVTTLVSPVVTPVWLSLAGSTVAQPSAARMMADLAVVLVLPVALAQRCRASPTIALAVTRHKTAVGVVARLLVLVVMLKAAVDVAGYLPRLTPGLVLSSTVVCLGVHLAALVLGFSGARALGFERGDCIAVAFASSQKTLPVALYLYQSYYATEYPLAVLSLALYHVGQLVADTLIADRLAPPPGTALRAGSVSDGDGARR